MKIKGNKTQSQVTVYGTAQVYESRPKAVETEKDVKFSAKGDWVELSGQGKLIADAQRAVAFIPDIRMPLVTRIQNDLEKGDYVFDHMKSAENILQESFENQSALGL